MKIIQKELKPGILLLELSGPLQMGVECKQLELAFDEILSAKQTRVILDLSGVTKLDSSGLGKIVNCFSRIKTAGGSLCLTGSTRTTDGLLKMTHADRFLKCYPSALAAAESFNDSAD